MQSNRLLAIVGVLSLIAGALFLPISSQPDLFPGGIRILGILGFFLFWIVSLMCWGNFFSRLFRLSEEQTLFLSLPIGVAWLILVLFLVGQLGGVSYLYRPVWILFLSAGIGLNLLDGKWAPAPRWKRPAGLSWFEFIMLMAILWVPFQYLAVSLLPVSAPDDFMYHLLGPRLWADGGRIHFNPQYPFIYLSWYWETLNLSAQILMGDEQGKGLLEAHIFSRWIHVVVGFVGSLSLVYGLLVHAGWSRSWRLAGLLAVLSGGELLSAAASAKNDWGIVFLMLAGIYSSQALSSGRKNILLTGGFFGLALASKASVAFVLLAYGLFWWRLKRDIRLPVKWAALSFLVLVPLLIRNSLGTSNPFYPFMMQLFPVETISEFTRDYFLQIQAQGFSPLVSIWGKLLTVLLDSMLTPLAVVFLLLASFMKIKGTGNYGWGWVMCLGGSLWFPLLEMPLSFTRWVSLPLLIFPLLSVALLHHCSSHLRLLKDNMKLLMNGLAITLSCLVLWKHSDLRKLHDLASPHSLSQVLLGHPSGAAKAWARLEMPSDSRALVTADNGLYYVSHLNIQALNEVPGLLDSLASVDSDLERVKLLMDSGVSYLLNHHYPNAFWGWFHPEVSLWVQRYPKAVIFKNGPSSVIDLRKLYEELSNF